MTIRVLVVDDHRLVRAGLTALLNGTGEAGSDTGAAGEIVVVGAAADGAEAVALTAQTRPDVVLMDLSMPGTDGVSATRAILAIDPRVQVVVLTSFSDVERILDAVDAGAVGYLLKDAAPGELRAAVRAAARGESPLDPKVARSLLTARGVRQPAETLTEREWDVLRLVEQGLANKQIARRLEISERTVKAHLTSVFHRIGVADRTSAALWARRQGERAR